MLLGNVELCSSILRSVASAKHFNFAERERVLERLTLEHRAFSLNIGFQIQNYINFY
jgi:hypothetical protein